MEPGWDAHCVDFIARHYKAVTGKNLWRVLHHRCPRSAREAAELYRKLGVTNLRDAVGKVLGAPLGPAFAMRGDIVLVMSGNIAALGIVRGDLIECMDNTLPITRAECAWRLSPFRPE